MVFLLVFGFLYLFAFSHGNSRFKQQLHWEAQDWPQPRPDARNWVQQHSLYSEKAAADVRPSYAFCSRLGLLTSLPQSLVAHSRCNKPGADSPPVSHLEGSTPLCNVLIQKEGLSRRQVWLPAPPVSSL